MSDEMWAGMKAIAAHQKQEKRKARLASDAVKAEAQSLALQNGLLLVRHSEMHWSLHADDEWLITIWPGPQRLARHGHAPWLTLAENWTVLDVVKAAIEARKP